MVGAGLQLIASGIAGQPPIDSIRNGSDFVEHLVNFGTAGVDAVVIDTVARLWRDWQASGLPRHVAEEHISVLADLLEAYRVEPTTVRAALAALDDGKCTCTIAADQLTALVIGPASSDLCFEDTGLNRQITFFFVQRMLVSLLERRNVLRDLEVAIGGYFAHLERMASLADSEEPPHETTQHAHEPVAA